MKITVTPNHEDRKMTPEERRIIDAMSSLAALFGNALFYYGRSVLHVTFDQYEEIEAAAAAMDEDDIFTLAQDPPAAAGTDIKEPESPGTQIIQLLTLLHPDVKKAFGTSAIYQIMSDALNHFDRTGETLEDQIHGMNLVPLAGFWIISKRVMALGHKDDCFRMIDALLAATKEGKQLPPLDLAEISDTDFVNVSAFYDSYFAVAPHPVEAEIPEEKPEEPTSITTFTATDKLYLPASKVFRKQQEIAIAGALGINVGRENHPVIVKASITDKDGKSPLLLTAFEMNIEAAVGQMFQMNGHKSFTCTPAQIYRIYAGLDAGDPVSEKQIEDTIKAMDKLLTTPATLDFTEQLEKHTKLKKREGFDYTDARRVGNLITGVHDQFRKHTYNGTEITDTFTIHEMPMFYAYSYAIGQLYTVSKYLLTGETPPDPEAQKKAKKKAADTRRLRSDDVDLRRFLLEYIEYQKTEREKRDAKLKRYNKPIPATFEFYLPFETVAEGIKCDTTSAKTMRRIREQTYDFMKSQAKNPESSVTFADYYKKGKALHGIRIRI